MKIHFAKFCYLAGVKLMTLSTERRRMMLFLVVMARETGFTRSNLPRMGRVAIGTVGIDVAARLMQPTTSLMARRTAH